ncbi:MAG: monovalent cation/H+ antiporter subunit D family protein [Proteobacteria bacterium]|nr:monovalent cation/H+ antiporter subunit D family protein [Pseudomonadota bacterium]
MNIHQSPLPILLVAIPLLFAFIIPVVGLWKKQLCFSLVVLAIGIALALSLKVSFEVILNGPISYYLGGWEPPWGIEYRIDYLGAFMTVLLTTISFIVAIYSKQSVKKEIPGREVYFYSVFLLLVTGLIGIVVTGDMFNLYVFLEISSLTVYALISLGDRAAPFSAFRYVVMGTIGACFYLLGVGYLYMVTGSLNMADLSRMLPELYQSKTVLVAFAFFIVGVSLKLALFPLHSWLPDAYTHAPSAVSALIAPTMTKVSAYMLVRIIFFVFEPHFSIEIVPVTTILSWLGAFAIIAGSVIAISQSDIKRMLAYSSVAQIGYIVLGVGLANRLGMTGGLLHIVNHAFMKCCLFLVAGSIIYKTGIRNIKQLRNLYIKMPYTTAAFTIAAFSMIGIPPTCGFFSKLYLILGSIDAGQWVFVVVILLSSLLNLIYFTNVLKHMYFPKPESELGARERPLAMPVRSEAPLSMLIPVLVVAAGIFLLGIFNGEIISGILDSAIPAAFSR